jgi:hypothetical protein
VDAGDWIAGVIHGKRLIKSGEPLGVFASTLTRIAVPMRTLVQGSRSFAGGTGRHVRFCALPCYYIHMVCCKNPLTAPCESVGSLLMNKGVP